MTAPAHPWRRIAAQTRFEAATILRHGEQLLVTFALPTIILAVLAGTDLLGRREIGTVMPIVITVAIMGSAFTGQAVATAFDRRSGVLRLLATTPLGRSGLVAGKVSAICVVVVLQMVLLGAIGVVLGWRIDISAFPGLLLGIAIGTAAFATLGLWLAGTVRAEGVLALANLVWVLLLLFGGILWPVSQLPLALGTVVQALPSAALMAALGQGADGLAALPALGILAIWAALGAVGATRSFRWE